MEPPLSHLERGPARNENARIFAALERGVSGSVSGEREHERSGRESAASAVASRSL